MRSYGSVMRLRTERLILRDLEMGDLDATTVLLGDAEALAHWDIRSTARARAVGLSAIRPDMNLTVSGAARSCCVRPVNSSGTAACTHDGQGEAEVELGWIVRRSCWGRGIAPEAAGAWCDCAFGSLEVPRIVSMIAADNAASRRVAEKLGMSIERPAIWGGEPMLMYALLREAWTLRTTTCDYVRGPQSPKTRKPRLSRAFESGG